MNDHVYGVILAGGSGTRFWPLSRERFPKQLLRIVGEGTLLQQTFERLDTTYFSQTHDGCDERYSSRVDSASIE